MDLNKAKDILRSEGDILRPIIEALCDFELYMVGGAVRDSILDIKPKDIDLVTNALPNTIIERLVENGITSFPRGITFGVVVAVLNDVEYEIASFRRDIHSGSGDNTEDTVVLGVSFEDDINRRDFTINAIAYDINNDSIIDLVGGVDDIVSKTLRCVGCAKLRFEEDNSRKLRAIRFASKYNLKIDINITNSIKSNNVLNCKREIIISELHKMFDFNPILSSELLDNLTLTNSILEGVELKKELSGNTFDLSSYFASRIVEDYSNFKTAMEIIQHRKLKDRITYFWMTSENNFISLLENENDVKKYIKMRNNITLEDLKLYGSFLGFKYFYENDVDVIFKDITRDVINDGFTKDSISREVNRRMVLDIKSKEDI